MWSPKQVQAGKTCGCVCPACKAPLVAKAVESAFRRPHFAHLGETNCRAGYETALHLRAKEIIAEHLRLALPAWNGEETMPNPPSLPHAGGARLYGRRIEFGSRVTQLLSAQVEQSCGDYTPDVIGLDDRGPLLIEIRVTHAVDELKRRRIQSEGQRMVEIDLSKLRLEQVVDEALLKHWVLDEPSNRTWLSCPAATDDWRESFRALKSDLIARNEEIAQAQRKREEDLLEYERARAHIAAAVAAKQGAREQFRIEKRSRFVNELDLLPELVSVERINRLLAEYHERDDEVAEMLIAAVRPDAVKSTLRRFGNSAWIYLVHPKLWQAATYHHFVHEQTSGKQFNQCDVARWVLQQFGKEVELYELFKAQYVARSEARKAGIRKYTISHWAFSDQENRQIPNFYSPINDFVARLVRIGSLECVPDRLGEVRVL